MSKTSYTELPAVLLHVLYNSVDESPGCTNELSFSSPPAHPQPKHPGVRLPDPLSGWHRILPAPSPLHPVPLSAGAAVLHRLDARDGRSHRSVLGAGLLGETSSPGSLFRHSRDSLLFFS